MIYRSITQIRRAFYPAAGAKMGTRLPLHCWDCLRPRECCICGKQRTKAS